MARHRLLLRFSPLLAATGLAPVVAGGVAYAADPEAARVAVAVPARLARAAAAAAAIVAGEEVLARVSHACMRHTQGWSGAWCTCRMAGFGRGGMERRARSA
jgi:cytochrome c5